MIFFNNNLNFLFIKKNNYVFFNYGDWGLGIGDWGLDRKSVV